ncbi:MAG: PilZ domain-containing protein [Alcanivoracaceae bacterium]|nr:PilZ domain-containing protein [Alcanivoracaceae bacterium]
MRQRTHRERLNINIPARMPGNPDPIGHVADISLTGLCISGKGEVPGEPIRVLTLSLPWTIDGYSAVELGVESRWQEYTGDGHWHAGFRISACPEEQLLALEQLVQRFGESS